MVKLYHDGGFYHIETSPLICRANQWTGSYMMRPSFMKELKYKKMNISRKENDFFMK